MKFNLLKDLISPKPFQDDKKTCISGSQYNTSEELTGIQTTHEFNLKDIVIPKRSHSRVLSQPTQVLTPEILFGHRRQRSLGQKPGCNFQNRVLKDDSGSAIKKILTRENSECDIPVYKEDIVKSIDMLKKSLPVFGCNPCTAYCSSCKKEVNTRVEFSKKNDFRFNFLDFISSFFACCGEPNWMLKLRMHKCEECNKILARSCK